MNITSNINKTINIASYYEKIDMEEQSLLSRGLSLPLMEDFYSIQGEGFHTGTPSYFIRIGGCDVGCHWCDIKESWNSEIHPLTPTTDIVNRILPEARTVVITGGEPLEYNMNVITGLIKDKGLDIHLETSGSNSLTGKWDWICLSPKKFKPPLPEIYPLANELKVIIRNNRDFVFAESEAKKVSDNCRLFLQPEWSVSPIITPIIIDYVKKHPKWRISVQLHKYLKIP